MKYGYLGLGALVAMALVGCGGVEGGEFEDEQVAEAGLELEDDNGLDGIYNGWEEGNGVRESNGLSAELALADINNLPENSLLLSTDAGRKTFKYLMKCTLPSGQYIDKGGVRYYGSVGAAAGWATGSCDEVCQEKITACMGAHMNRTGNSVQIFLVADGTDFPTVGPGLSGAYPRKEGAFFGNIFKNPPEMYYCESPNAQTSPINGRIGSGFVSPQYTNPYSSGTRLCGDGCDDIAGSTGSGWSSCTIGQKTWNHVMNVWTQ